MPPAQRAALVLRTPVTLPQELLEPCHLRPDHRAEPSSIQTPSVPTAATPGSPTSQPAGAFSVLHTRPFQCSSFAVWYLLFLSSTQTLSGDRPLKVAPTWPATSGWGEVIVRQVEPVHLWITRRSRRPPTVALSMRQSCVP